MKKNKKEAGFGPFFKKGISSEKRLVKNGVHQEIHNNKKEEAQYGRVVERQSQN